MQIKAVIPAEGFSADWVTSMVGRPLGPNLGTILDAELLPDGIMLTAEITDPKFQARLAANLKWSLERALDG